MTVFAAGFLEPTLNAILAKKTPGEMQGRVFGWASSTRSFGWALGPLLAGAVAAHHLRGVFFSAGVGYAALAGLTGWMLWREGNSTQRRRETEAQRSGGRGSHEVREGREEGDGAEAERR